LISLLRLAKGFYQRRPLLRLTFSFGAHGNRSN
jgi:hypothetical protein